MIRATQRLSWQSNNIGLKPCVRALTSATYFVNMDYMARNCSRTFWSEGGNLKTRYFVGAK
jgi:hypothetical protein